MHHMKDEDKPRKQKLAIAYSYCQKKRDFDNLTHDQYLKHVKGHIRAGRYIKPYMRQLEQLDAALEQLERAEKERKLNPAQKRRRDELKRLARSLIEGALSQKEGAKQERKKRYKKNIEEIERRIFQTVKEAELAELQRRLKINEENLPGVTKRWETETKKLQEERVSISEAAWKEWAKKRWDQTNSWFEGWEHEKEIERIKAWEHSRDKGEFKKASAAHSDVLRSIKILEEKIAKLKAKGFDKPKTGKFDDRSDEDLLAEIHRRERNLQGYKRKKARQPDAWIRQKEKELEEIAHEYDKRRFRRSKGYDFVLVYDAISQMPQQWFEGMEAGGKGRIEPMKSLAVAATGGKHSSSNVEKVGYYNSMLEVEFYNGDRYVYFVGPEFYDKFVAAPSKGKFVWENLRGKMPGLVFDDPTRKTPGGVGSKDPVHKPYSKGTGGTPQATGEKPYEPRLPEERERKLTHVLTQQQFSAAGLKWKKMNLPKAQDMTHDSIDELFEWVRANTDAKDEEEVKRIAFAIINSRKKGGGKAKKPKEPEKPKFEPIGRLTPTEHAMLRELIDIGKPIQAKQIRRMASSITANQTLQKLVEKGLVDRIPIPGGNRAKYQITGRGLDVEEQVKARAIIEREKEKFAPEKDRKRIEDERNIILHPKIQIHKEVMDKKNPLSTMFRQVEVVNEFFKKLPPTAQAACSFVGFYADLNKAVGGTTKEESVSGTYNASNRHIAVKIYKNEWQASPAWQQQVIAHECAHGLFHSMMTPSERVKIDSLYYKYRDQCIKNGYDYAAKNRGEFWAECYSITALKKLAGNKYKAKAFYRNMSEVEKYIESKFKKYDFEDLIDTMPDKKGKVVGIVFSYTKGDEHVFGRAFIPKEISMDEAKKMVKEKRARFFHENERYDLKDDEGHEGRWVTMRGTHVFIRAGESPKEAILRKVSGLKGKDLKAEERIQNLMEGKGMTRQAAERAVREQVEQEEREEKVKKNEERRKKQIKAEKKKADEAKVKQKQILLNERIAHLRRLNDGKSGSRTFMEILGMFAEMVQAAQKGGDVLKPVQSYINKLQRDRMMNEKQKQKYIKQIEQLHKEIGQLTEQQDMIRLDKIPIEQELVYLDMIEFVELLEEAEFHDLMDLVECYELVDTFDFDLQECIGYYEGKGKSEEDAKYICGAIIGKIKGAQKKEKDESEEESKKPPGQKKSMAQRYMEAKNKGKLPKTQAEKTKEEQEDRLKRRMAANKERSRQFKEKQEQLYQEKLAKQHAEAKKAGKKGMLVPKWVREAASDHNVPLQKAYDTYTHVRRVLEKTGAPVEKIDYWISSQMTMHGVEELGDYSDDDLIDLFTEQTGWKETWRKADDAMKAQRAARKRYKQHVEGQKRVTQRSLYGSYYDTDHWDLTMDFADLMSGPITRAGPFVYGEKVLHKDWNNLKEVFSNIDHLPVIGSKGADSHLDTEDRIIGFAHNFKLNEDTKQVLADVETFKEIEELSDLENPSDLPVSLGFKDEGEGDVQKITGIQHVAMSLNGLEQDRCSSAGGLSCTVSKKTGGKSDSNDFHDSSYSEYDNIEN